nr:hypothetical protein [uncultured Cellulosilyticum sp.]
MIGSWLIAFLFFVGGLFIIGISTKHMILKKGTNKESEQYWAREHAATFARKSEIPAAFFMAIDFSVYPVVDDEGCTQLYNKIMLFKERPLVNLKGMSNVELKERFGTMQLEKLSYYEQNLMEYMTTSCAYGKLLFEKGYLPESQKVLEYIISLGCDLSQCYLTLADVYVAYYDYNKLSNTQIGLLTDLKQKASINMNASPYLQKVIQGIDACISHLT